MKDTRDRTIPVNSGPRLPRTNHAVAEPVDPFNGALGDGSKRETKFHRKTLISCRRAAPRRVVAWPRFRSRDKTQFHRDAYAHCKKPIFAVLFFFVSDEQKNVIKRPSRKKKMTGKTIRRHRRV